MGDEKCILALPLPMILIESIHDHPFFTEASAESVAVQRKLGIGPFDDAEPPVDEYQFYVMRVGFTLAHTITWIEQLHQAVYFLSDFTYSKKQKEVGIQRSHHLFYNVENYLVRLNSVYDRLLHLVNTVFHLCVNEQSVQHTMIVSNLKVARTDIPKLLRAVRRTIDHKTQDRNDIVHRHSYADRDLRRLEVMYMHTAETWGGGQRFSFRQLQQIRSRLLKKAVDEKKAEFCSINKALIDALIPLFTALHGHYAGECARLR